MNLESKRKWVELKTCPLCGGGATLETRHSFGLPAIHCIKCNCSLHGRYEDINGLVEAWNARVKALSYLSTQIEVGVNTPPEEVIK